MYIDSSTHVTHVFGSWIATMSVHTKLAPKGNTSYLEPSLSHKYSGPYYRTFPVWDTLEILTEDISIIVIIISIKTLIFNRLSNNINKNFIDNYVNNSNRIIKILIIIIIIFFILTYNTNFLLFISYYWCIYILTKLYGLNYRNIL